MSKPVKLGALGFALSLLTTACFKSSEPVVFAGQELASVEGTILGYAIGQISSETNKVTRAYQLRDEADGIYLYMCPASGDEPAELQRARARVSEIPGQRGFAVVSLEEGDFLFGETNPGHEFLIVQPLRDRMLVSILDSNSTTKDEAFRYFSEVPTVAISTNSSTYPVEAVQEFLTEYLDEWWPEEEKSSYRYFNGNLTSCNFNR